MRPPAKTPELLFGDSQPAMAWEKKLLAKKQPASVSSSGGTTTMPENWMTVVSKVVKFKWLSRFDSKALISQNE